MRRRVPGRAACEGLSRILWLVPGLGAFPEPALCSAAACHAAAGNPPSLLNNKPTKTQLAVVMADGFKGRGMACGSVHSGHSFGSFPQSDGPRQAPAVLIRV